MAGTKAPLFSLDASGTIGKAITFSRWKGRSYVRRHAVPANPRSGLQVGMRSVFRWTTNSYTNLDAAAIADWQALAVADNITPLNAHVRDSQKRARLGQGWRRDTTTAALVTIDPPTALVTTAQPKGLRLAWDRPLANQGEYTFAIYLFTSTGFSAGISNLIRVGGINGPPTYDVAGLVTGTTYFWLVRETSRAGELGTISAEGTGTPT